MRPLSGTVLTLAALAALALPLGWMLVASLGPEERLFEGLRLVPAELTFDHFRVLFAERGFWAPIRSSLVVAGSTALLSVAIGAGAGYAIARLRFRGKSLLVAGTLAVAMLPQISIVPPLYLVLRAVGLLDTYPGLVVPYLGFALPFGVWLLSAYFERLPPGLEEAAMVDGASRIQTLLYVVLPAALPGVMTTALLVFVYSWNEFLCAFSFTLSPERHTVPVAIALLRGRYQVPWGQVLAAATLATLPVALVVFAFQRRIVQSFGAPR